jgi:branched-chain amino acid aminotransferase
MTNLLAGYAYVKDRYMPLAEAMIPVVDWRYRRSDVTYDVVTVWKGSFFRLDAHLPRFRRSMNKLAMKPRESDDEIHAILMDRGRRSGLRDAYVAMDCLHSKVKRRQLGRHNGSMCDQDATNPRAAARGLSAPEGGGDKK